MGKFLNYLIDPYKSLNADYLFMEFIEFYKTYLNTWDKLNVAGSRITGVGGLDSHQNVFKQKASDGERLDSHRRMTRMMNNFVISPDRSYTSMKTALKNGKVYFVVEGLGTPYDFDFRLSDGTSNFELGDELIFDSGKTYQMTIRLPSLHPDSDGLQEEDHGSPTITGTLLKAQSDGSTQVVAHFSQKETTLPITEAGVYRVEFQIKPEHLNKVVSQEDYSFKTFTWMVSNPIYLRGGSR
jgi:hypothetical protein